ncbi:hypothetical protein H311_01763 [Anncaliia algerae PRA109]|nr:hypothetical protein H311_01763 [Anncaliia algerae PRA109]
MTPDQMETFLIRACTKELIDYLMGENMLKRERQCGNCSYFMQLVTYKKSIDKYAWRCMNKTCQKYKNYESIRKDSFFEKFRLDLTLILRITIKYGVRQAMHSIKNSLDCNPKYIECVILKIKSLIPMWDVQGTIPLRCLRYRDLIGPFVPEDIFILSFLNLLE